MEVMVVWQMDGTIMLSFPLLNIRILKMLNE
nr:MAG TPA: hypothetical protein [Caudoviricetes sp.]